MAGQKKRYPAGIPVRQHFFLIPSPGLFQIGNDVLFVLDTHEEAEEAVMELRLARGTAAHRSPPGTQRRG